MNYTNIKNISFKKVNRILNNIKLTYKTYDL